MAKVKFEFDLISEYEEIKSFIEGDKWQIAIWDLDQEMRATTKYEKSLLDDNGKATEIEIQIAEKIREIIREKMENHGLFFK
jgi:hypothetical protein